MNALFDYFFYYDLFGLYDLYFTIPIYNNYKDFVDENYISPINTILYYNQFFDNELESIYNILIQKHYYNHNDFQGENYYNQFYDTFYHTYYYNENYLLKDIYNNFNNRDIIKINNQNIQKNTRLENGLNNFEIANFNQLTGIYSDNKIVKKYYQNYNENYNNNDYKEYYKLNEENQHTNNYTEAYENKNIYSNIDYDLIFEQIKRLLKEEILEY